MSGKPTRGAQLHAELTFFQFFSRVTPVNEDEKDTLYAGK